MRKLKVVIHNNDDVSTYDTIAHIEGGTIKFTLDNDSGNIDIVLQKDVDSVTMTMSGEFSAIYSFKENHDTHVQYVTQYGEMSLPLKCKQIQWTIDKIYIAYEVDMGDKKPHHNSLTLIR